MIEAIRNFYWALPVFVKISLISFIAYKSFKACLKNAIDRKDYASASICMLIFVLVLIGVLKSMPENFKLI